MHVSCAAVRWALSVLLLGLVMYDTLAKGLTMLLLRFGVYDCTFMFHV